jgi:hypothetical protein
MIASKGIVLDANILIRAAFGQQVRHILKKYEDQARFYTPDVALGDARKYVIAISELRQVNSSLGSPSLINWQDWSSKLIAAFTNSMSKLLANESTAAIPMTGPWWP